MNTIKFFKRSTEFGPNYDISDEVNALDKLAIFLFVEVVCFGSARLTRLINELKDEEETSGNMMKVQKVHDNAYISDVYYDGPEKERKCFVMPIGELIALMQSWEELMKRKPDEIILTGDNGKIQLIGKEL
jgi:hypothetical protein